MGDWGEGFKSVEGGITRKIPRYTVKLARAKLSGMAASELFRK